MSIVIVVANGGGSGQMDDDVIAALRSVLAKADRLAERIARLETDDDVLRDADDVLDAALNEMGMPY